jgi:protein-ribulosamine 3-kinase
VIPPEIESEITQSLRQNLTPSFAIFSSSDVGGGDINYASRLETSSGTYFVKFNDAGKYPEMFEKEAHGLNLIRASNTLFVPEIIQTGTKDGYAWLMLEFIESAPPDMGFMAGFGQALARMHQNTWTHYGLDTNNYMGSLEQFNLPNVSWIDFFIEQRLIPQVSLARNEDNLTRDTANLFDRIFSKLDRWLPVDQPALLHGDLWSGNFMVNQQGKPCLIDPAVYYGHREVDLAMTTLFGGFSKEFYEGYEAVYPLEAGWKERLPLYNLYPLLIHLNLFGHGYLNQISQILNRFARSTSL